MRSRAFLKWIFLFSFFCFPSLAHINCISLNLMINLCESPQPLFIRFNLCFCSYFCYVTECVSKLHWFYPHHLAFINMTLSFWICSSVFVAFSLRRNHETEQFYMHMHTINAFQPISFCMSFLTLNIFLHSFAIFAILARLSSLFIFSSKSLYVSAKPIL